VKWYIFYFFVEYSFLFPLVQKVENRLRVIIKTKVARFYGSRCIYDVSVLLNGFLF